MLKRYHLRFSTFNNTRFSSLTPTLKGVKKINFLFLGGYIKKYFKQLFFVLFIFGLFTSCEEEITVDLPVGNDKLVVEGYIEPDAPPYIMLTRTIPYFSNLSKEMNNLFVHDAKMTLSDGEKTVNLIEIDLRNLPDTLAKLILDVFQYSVDSNELSSINFAFYTSLEMRGEAGKSYKLEINSGDKNISATTTIPKLIVPDTIWSEKPKFPVKNDSLRMVQFKIQEPGNEENFYRIFTKRNSEPFYTSRFRSVSDDQFFNGQHYTWFLERGEDKYGDFNFDEYGLFRLGDTITLKFCTIDKPHFNFWNTFEISRSSGGPFANPIQIQSNIEGDGLGVWGGYGAAYVYLIIKD